MITGGGCYGVITEWLEDVPLEFAKNRLNRLGTDGVTVSEVAWKIESLWERLRDLRAKRRIELYRRYQRDMDFLP